MSDELAPAPLPEIAPVEVLLATIGLKPIISRAVETISSEKLAEMAGMPDEIRRLAKQLVRSESVSVPAPSSPVKLSTVTKLAVPPI